MLGAFYPGTLNVYVAGQHDYAPNERNYPEPNHLQQQGYLTVRECTVNGIAAWLLRCECPGPSHRPPPIDGIHTMFEIIAREYIANIRYKSAIVLEFEEGVAHLKDLPWVT